MDQGIIIGRAVILLPGAASLVEAAFLFTKFKFYDIYDNGSPKGGDDPKGAERWMYTKSPRTEPVATSFSSNRNQIIGERVKKILADDHQLSNEDKFILTQIYLICLFREAQDSWRRRKLSKSIIHREDNKGQEISLTPEDFRNLNLWVVNQDMAGKLPNLIKRVKQKRRETRAKK